MKRISNKHQNLEPEKVKQGAQDAETLLNQDATSKLSTVNQSPKKFDAKKFCGALKTNEDAMVLQKRWRDEW